MSTEPVARIHALLTGEDDRPGCDDVPEAACRAQPGNFLKHLLSLAATKTGDGLADPKLTLTWLLGQLGAPAAAVGLLVPVREAGALLPQLALAPWVRSRPRRKFVWAAGSAVQGLAVLGMAAVAFTCDGALAGWLVVALLTVFALARSACSTSYKDILGRTVAKSTRGTATGTASSIAAVFVLGFGALLGLGLLATSVPVVGAALLVAGGLWLAAAGLFTTVVEAADPDGDPDGEADRDRPGFLGQLRLLREDCQLRLFVLTRGLLIATALAPPYLVALGSRGTSGFGQLGPFVVASSLAAVLGGHVWGRLADRSSRRVLILAAAGAALVLGATATIALTAPTWLHGWWPLPTALFLLMLAYQGVRVGRSTHLVDMADADRRASYTAVANTTIGVLLLVGGAFGALAQGAGEAAVLAVFAVLCAVAVPLAARLEDVQAT